MKKWLCLCLLASPGWARPGMSASEARALSRQNMTYRQACQQPHDHVFAALWIRAEQFTLSDLHATDQLWSSERKPGQALFALPASLRGHVLQIQLDATFMQGEMRFFTANLDGQPLEEILTYHVPDWEQDCDHAITHSLRVTAGQALLINLPPHSKMRLRRLVVQALN